MRPEICPTHLVTWKVIPAGVSKTTGRPYASFKVCPEKDCKQRPEYVPSTSVTPPQAPQPTVAPVVDESPDWDQIARGKVRTHLLGSMIQNQGLVPLTDEMKVLLEEYLLYCMEGR